jgi:hypothetical protein
MTSRETRAKADMATLASLVVAHAALVTRGSAAEPYLTLRIDLDPEQPPKETPCNNEDSAIH